MSSPAFTSAVITGGASGIGLALAKRLGRAGTRIVIAEPDEARLQPALAQLKELGVTASTFSCDVRELAQVEALADFAWDTHGNVDLMVNNAGIGLPRKAAVDARMDRVRNLFDVNFFGVWHGCRVFGQRFAAQELPAAIYNTGSENSLFNASPSMAAYVASKHAVYGLTDSLREEMPEHVHVGMIVPGFVATGLTEQVAHLAMDADTFANIIAEQMEAREFYAVSHGNNMEHIDTRYAELTKAYQRYAPRYDGDDEYDIRKLMVKLGMSQKP